MGHPSDVHFFNPIINGLKKRGHKIYVIAREKEVTFFLLNKLGIEYFPFSTHKKRIHEKLINYGYRWWKLYQLCRRIKPDVSIGVGDFILPQISCVLNFRSIVFTDIEWVFHDRFLTFPFASQIITPSSFKLRLGNKHTRIDSYKELAYVRNTFSPDPGVPNLIDLTAGEPYVLIRFVSHSAMHDICSKGLSDLMKLHIAKTLSRYARVFISSEDPLHESLEAYRLPTGPDQIHSVMYHAAMVYGESSTMAAESSLMGTPAIFIDHNGRGYTDDIEACSGLLNNFGIRPEEIEKSLEKSIQILKSRPPRSARMKKINLLISRKQDMAKQVIRLIDPYNHDA